MFKFKTGKLPALEQTDNGDVPLVYGTTYNNGVIKFVNVDSSDEVFPAPLITVSYLGTAFVQVVPFTTSVVDKSNIIILVPIAPMTIEEMYFYTYQINLHAKFGFHYGRRLNMKKLKNLDVQQYDISPIKINFSKILPSPKITHNEKIIIKKMDQYPITKLFHLYRGDFHAIDQLNCGNFPTVSRITINNGIIGFFDKPDKAHTHPKLWLTVSTTSGNAFIQLTDFIATDNVVLLEPKLKLKLTSLIFIQFMINKVNWRYSYGRQCYKKKFEKTIITLPTKDNGELDEDNIETIVKNSKYFDYIDDYLKNN